MISVPDVHSSNAQHKMPQETLCSHKSSRWILCHRRLNHQHVYQLMQVHLCFKELLSVLKDLTNWNRAEYNQDDETKLTSQVIRWIHALALNRRLKVRHLSIKLYFSLWRDGSSSDSRLLQWLTLEFICQFSFEHFGIQSRFYFRLEASHKMILYSFLLSLLTNFPFL